MSEQQEPGAKSVRNWAVLIYMVGNALTFTKLLQGDPTGLQSAGELGGRVVGALLLSFVWPFYWIGRLLFG